MKENQFDPIDLLILKELTTDARIPFTQLSKKLKVSNTLIHQRVRKLKEAGIIDKAIYRLEPATLGYQTSAYTQIMLTNSKLHREVERELQKIPEIVECVNISGRYALLVKIYAHNNRHLRDIIYERILTIEGVEGTNSTICFETNFVRNVPLELEN
ncbi:MAG: Lrp/AsnC family transcriptional regulator [Chitinophagales bacterium]